MPTSDPLFSIIVPTHNRPSLLMEALASVAAQTVDDFECIVVDDASEPPARVPDDFRFQLYRRQAPSGPGAARNVGMQIASGQFLAFLDDDDLYVPERLALALEGLRQAPIVICWTRFLDERTSRGRSLDGDVQAVIANETTPHLGATVVERQLAQPFDEQFRSVEDVDWWIRITRRAPVATVPRCGCLIRRHDAPRGIHGIEQRIRDSQLLLEVHRDYFRANPAAAAFRWRRIGIMAHQVGDPKLARSALLRSMRLQPSIRTARHLIRRRVLTRGPETAP